MLNIGLAKEIMTPPFGACLAGYFNLRPARGVLDDICVRAIIMEKDGKWSGILSFDLCYLVESAFMQLRQELKAAGIAFADDIMLAATHTHTGTDMKLFDVVDGVPCAQGFSMVIKAAVRAAKRAIDSMAPAQFLYAECDGNPYGYVRRYFMKNGAVVTNPSRCNPDIVKPETDYDEHIRVLAVKQYGRISALLVNLANHCDTVGGDMVCADWPGRMEAALQYALTEDIPVFTLTDASGNINHFDVSRKIDQTNYAEAVRIGRGYAAIVSKLLPKLEPVDEGAIEVSHATFMMPHRVITEEEYAAAKKYLEDTKDAPVTEGDLTSEGLANGDVTVLRYFANRVINCHDKSTPAELCRLTRISLGKALAFVSLPGEPFNGIAQAIRKASPYGKTIVVELAESRGAYVPMRECFARGGYEVQPDVNTVAPEASDVLIQAAIDNL